MNNGKFRRKSRRFHSRYVLVLVSVAMICATAIGASLAYLTATDDSIPNEFTPSQVTSLVVEDPFNGETKSNVKIQNTGDVSAFIRAEVVVTWKAEDGGVLHMVPSAKANENDEEYDYVIEYGTDWFEKDGYYYWPSEVAKDGYTDNLIESATATAKKTDTTGKEYFVSIEILSSAIQSVPETAVERAWGVVCTGNTISAN